MTEPEFVPLSIAVVTVSDTRDIANDTSGALIIERIEEAGHRLTARLATGLTENLLVPPCTERAAAKRRARLSSACGESCSHRASGA